MKRTPAWLVTCMGLVTSIIIVVVSFAQTPQSQSRATMWKKVDEALQKGLPKTAIDELAPIIKSALDEKAYAEAFKAIAKKTVLTGQIEGGRPDASILQLQKEVAGAPPELKPLMHALLAQWYWSYFQQNRWQFANRTATAESPSEDFSTWDLKRIFAEIDKEFGLALAASAELKTIPIAAYDALLDKGTMSSDYRPTLYDFFAFMAIDFYSSGEQAGAQSEDMFEIDAAGAALGTVEDFMAWQPNTTDLKSPKLKAIQLYQSLLSFHKDDRERSAFLDTELGRLRFAHANAIGEEKTERYKSALKRFADLNNQHELSATARHRLAELLSAESELVDARSVALQGKNAFPKSNGGKLCSNLVQTIESKDYSVATERVWTDPLPNLRIQYKNISKIYFRVISADWVTRFSQDRWRPDQMNEADREKWITQTPVMSWSAELPATDDYRQLTHDVPAPKGLKPGYYFVLASSNPEFSDVDNWISSCEVWVTDLALVMRQSWGEGRLEGFVLNAKSGEPIAGAKVRTFFRDERRQIKEGVSYSTDANGLFSIPGESQGVFLLASRNGNEIASSNEYSSYLEPSRIETSSQYVLFTDRAIYRPGQTVHFKGIAFQADLKVDRYETVSGVKVTPAFRDTNGKEIATLELVSNDFGSFTGSFTIPRDRGTGVMSIVVLNGQTAASPIRVEEYKRPKFQVKIDPPKTSVKLNEKVTVSGKATAYTGASIDGAKVRYRVTRQVRWPQWFMSCYSWRMPQNPGQSQEIAHGWTTTGPDGAFEIAFEAKPDRSVPESNQPTFYYAIQADVTDGSGETRTGDQSVRIGYVAMEVGLTAKDYLEANQDFAIKIATTTLDQQAVSAKGTIRVHRLKEPNAIVRSELLGHRIAPRQRVPQAKPKSSLPVSVSVDLSLPSNWELGALVESKEFSTTDEGVFERNMRLPRGNYRVIVNSQDRYGKPVVAELNLQVIDPKANNLGLKIANLLVAPKWKWEPGETMKAIWGTGYDTGRAFVEIEHRGKVIQGYWTKPGSTQNTIEQLISESMRGGFTIRTTFVRENRAFMESRSVEVPWSNKDLTVKWERFVSKLEPGAKETFTLAITGPNATKASAEFLATLYDASLDAFAQQNWMRRFYVFRTDYSRLSSVFHNTVMPMNPFRGGWKVNSEHVDIRYPAFPNDLQFAIYSRRFESMMARGGAPGGPGGYGGFGGGGMASAGAGMSLGAPFTSASLAEAPMAKDAMLGDSPVAPSPTPGSNEMGGNAGSDASKSLDLNNVSVRTNLNETAFFMPQLVSDSDGVVKLTFTMPEALTEWNFLGFAHDRELRSGFLDGSLVTAKDLMIQPNPPRFLREEDEIEFSVKVVNRSDKLQSGKVALQLFDARTNASVDADYSNTSVEKPFEVAAKQSASFAWKLKVPNGAYPIIYKVIGATEKLSDGEEGMLPVLSKRLLVTESLPLPIRGKTTREFDFKKLLESGQSKTLQHQSLTVQMTSQPAWYAVLALPYLMEYQHECSEQTFNRMYSNAIAQHIAKSDPKIHRVFETWRTLQPGAFESPLSKNQDIKSVMIEETPWLRAANRESEARRNVGVLFDDDRLHNEVSRAAQRLSEMQRENGMWPWFPGGPDNEYLSLYIVTGFGRMKSLGVQVDNTPALKALARLDDWMRERYESLLTPAGNNLSETAALYLYGRSFFLNETPVAEQNRVAWEYWQQQARRHWLNVGNRQSQAHIAIGLKRIGDTETPVAILASLKENSVSNEEMGMFWRDTERSWWWYHAEIETQALMIEAFDLVADDADSVENCKVWLLKQKQTTNWKTTKGTADAVYALLLRGSKMLSSDALVQVQLADQLLVPEKVEAGTGFYEQKFGRGEIKPEMGKVTLTKTDEGVSWGSIHWQYLEDIDKVTPHDGTPLKLEKTLFKRVLTKEGPVLEAVTGTLHVGDELVCRIVLRTDRDMEYVHLKDHRGSGTEPVNVLSQYKFQDGLMYYESTRDTASHFFIDYLRKGTYVFEYTLRIQHAGNYPSGMASIECMYAPEFNSHSQSIPMVVAPQK